MNQIETPKRDPKGAVMSVCFKKGFYLKPLPWGNRFKIILEEPGQKPKTGSKTYPAKSDEHSTGVFDKMQEMYQQIAFKIQNSNNPKNSL